MSREQEPGSHQAVMGVDAPQELTCADCKTRIFDTYYTMGEKVLCSTCRTGVQLTAAEGSGAGRFARAVVLGVPAAAVGSAVYYAIGAWTGYEFGLVAIVIGLLVGGAVRYGSGGRGGWVYQSLAVVLTYCSIASTYMPGVMEAFRQQAVEEETAAHQTEEGDEGAAAFEPTDVAATSVTSDADAESGTHEVVLAFAVLFVISLAVPFLAGFENLMGLVIIGIGLYEAWQLNKRVDMEITGPHRVGA